MTPLKLLPLKEFQNRQKSIETVESLAITASMMSIKSESDEKKKKAKECKENGNKSFQKKKYEEAENFYSEGLQLHPGFRQLWTNRAICRNTMRKYQDAISDCDSALSIDPKCSKSMIQKGNAYLGLGLFDDAKVCYESLRSMGNEVEAATYLKKLENAQV